MVAKVIGVCVDEGLVLVPIFDVMDTLTEGLGDLMRDIEQPEADGKEHQLYKELAEEVIGGEQVCSQELRP